MSCYSNRIVRVTYPKNCCPEVDDSQQLTYSGPALQCIEVQTNQTLNDAIKEIDTLICNTLNSLTTTTTSTSSTTTSTTTTLSCNCRLATIPVYTTGDPYFYTDCEGVEWNDIIPPGAEISPFCIDINKPYSSNITIIGEDENCLCA